MYDEEQIQIEIVKKKIENNDIVNILERIKRHSMQDKSKVKEET